MPDTTKRAPKGQGTIRRRADGRYEGRVTINGERKSFFGDKQGDVVKTMRAAKKAADDGTYFQPAKMTVSAWLDTWLKEYVEPSVKPLTHAAYATQCKNHIKPALGKVKLAALNATQIQALYNAMSREEGLSSKTVKNCHGILHKALSKAVELRYIAYNPADACTLPRDEKKEIQPLTEKEIAQFLRCIENEPEPFNDLYFIALFTGMREGEVCGLPWAAVDFDKGTITVKQQLQKEKKRGGTYYLAPTKSDRTRTITPAPDVMDTLRDVRRKQLENKIRAGAAWGNAWGLVFTNALGGYILSQTAYNRFKRVVAKIGRPDARFHDLRHTYAVTSLQEGDDIKTVQQNLGHATASFTLDKYGHVSEKMKRESAARMQAFIRNIRP